MPLNYSKWDQLELSDDSDIEGHPNVDKKALVRLKQRDIHEKREQRKALIARLRADINCDAVILPRLKTIVKEIEEGGRAHFSTLVDRLTNQPSSEAPPENRDGHPTYDEIVKSYLLKVYEDVKEKGIGKDDVKLDQALVKGLQEHISKVTGLQEKRKADLQREEAEQAKKITSEDIHEGFQSKYVPAKPAPPPVEPQRRKKTKVTKETTFETLNAGAVAGTSSLNAAAEEADLEDSEEEDDEDDEGGLPELTPALQEFSKLPLRDYQRSWTFIQENRDVVVKGATDALLVEAFNAESRGEKQYAKQCVHQGLLLQYCDKLGKDGVRLFFQRMVKNDKRAEPVFLKDVEDTYRELAKRVAKAQAEEAATRGQEQIQLIQEDPSQPITFNVPDGPPPEELRLEGPGTENLDIEEVRNALQMRWDVFESFDEPLKKALKKGTLESVNKVLAKMEVPDAEETVRMLQMAGILSFADEGKVRDMTQLESSAKGALDIGE